ncbi:hypothetical protein JHK85_008337 [Glycine max]|nr:hypothetical protein JHK85_008337 [Glycine max]
MLQQEPNLIQHSIRTEDLVRLRSTLDGTWSWPVAKRRNLIEGLESFNGKVIHSTGYNNGKEFKDKLVLVVGSGNSGMEIALDLSNFGAKPSIIVRSPIDETIDVGTVKKIKSREIQVLPAEIDRKVSEVMKFCSEMANHAHSTQLFSAHASRDQLKSGFRYVVQNARRQYNWLYMRNGLNPTIVR